MHEHDSKAPQTLVSCVLWVVAQKLSAFFSLRTITFLLIVIDGFNFLEHVPLL